MRSALWMQQQPISPCILEIMPTSARLASSLDRLKSLHPKIIDLSLDRVLRLLRRLGNPEAALPPVVHVAGTNGKGSTIAFLKALLNAHGRSTPAQCHLCGTALHQYPFAALANPSL